MSTAITARGAEFVLSEFRLIGSVTVHNLVKNWQARQISGSLRILIAGSALMYCQAGAQLEPVRVAGNETNAGPVVANTPSGKPLEVLKSAMAVRALSTDEAIRGYPVQLRGVVTYSAPERSYFFVQDETSGIYVNTGDQRFNLNSGTLIELEGVSYSGKYEPGIMKPAVRQIGATEMPIPVHADINQLARGLHDSSWIQTRGVVRSMTDIEGGIRIVIASGGLKTSLHLPNFIKEAMVPDLVDSVVRIEGVSSTRFDVRGRLEEFQVLVPSVDHIHLEEPPPADPYSIPTRELGNLLRFTAPESDGRRIKVEGTVSFQRLGELLYVTDSTNAVCVWSTDTTAVQVGDRVEIIGFPEIGESSTVLQNASFRYVESGNPPAPGSVVTVRDALLRSNHGHLIRTEGVLVDRTIRPIEQVLVLQSEGFTFPAMLESTKAGQALENLREGSILRVTGICLIESDDGGRPETMQVLLRSPEDVVVMRSPPWWTLAHSLATVGAMLAVSLAVASWGVLLRRRVEQQTSLIRERLEREMTLDQRYHELFENANDIVYTTDLEGNFTSVNKAGERLFGHTRDEILKMNCFSLLPPEYLDVAREMTQRKLADGRQTTYKVEILGKNARRVPMELSTRLIYRGGKPFEVNGIARDLTERLRAEDALRKSEESLRNIIQNSPIGIVTFGLQHEMLTANRSFCEMIGCGSDDLIGRSLHEFTYTEDRERYFDSANALLEGRVPVVRMEKRLLHRSGAAFWIHLTAVLVRKSDGEVFCGLGMIENISARKQAEVFLSLSEQRFRKAFQAFPVSAAVSTLAGGCIVDVNDGFLKLFSFERDDVIGRNALELGIWSDSHQRAEVIRKLAEDRSLRDIECRFLTKSGERVEALVSAEIIDFGGEPCSLMITHDMTDRIRLENLLRQSQKMEAAGQLATGLVHDFNNIMTVVQGHTGLLLSSSEINAEARNSLTRVLEASARATNLTRQLMAFCRKQAIHRRLLNLNEVIDNINGMLEGIVGEKSELIRDFAEDLPAVSADVGMIEQVLVNLAVNARDAMPDGGELLICTRSCEIDNTAMQLNPEAIRGRSVCLRISDTGKGMDRETLSRVFEPFFSTKKVGKGTGLGLSIVYAIVRQHQGWIEADSEKGRGTTFRLYFPGKSQAPEELSTPSDETALPVGRETILVVEDEESLRYFVCHLLKRQGYRVLEAASGQEAIEIWAVEKKEIDMLFTDIVMPGGISGKDLAKRLQEDHPCLKVLFTSGYQHDMEDQVVQFQEGLNFLPKPYQPAKLATTVRNCFDTVQHVEGA